MVWTRKKVALNYVDLHVCKFLAAEIGPFLEHRIYLAVSTPMLSKRISIPPPLNKYSKLVLERSIDNFQFCLFLNDRKLD